MHSVQPWGHPLHEKRKHTDSYSSAPRHCHSDLTDPSSFPAQLSDTGLERAVSNILFQAADLAEFAHSDNGADTSRTLSSPGKAVFPKWSEPSSVFFSVTKPDIPVQTYVRRLVKYAQCSPSAFVVALVYMERLAKTDSKLCVSHYNLNRLLITSVCVAAKFLDDRCYSNAHYARVGGISTVAEMNRLEINLVQLMKFKLFVDVSEYSHKEKVLANAALSVPLPRVPSIQIVANTTSPLCGSSNVAATSPVTPTSNSKPCGIPKGSMPCPQSKSSPTGGHRQVSPVAVNQYQTISGYRASTARAEVLEPQPGLPSRQFSTGNVNPASRFASRFPVQSHVVSESMHVDRAHDLHNEIPQRRSAFVPGQLLSGSGSNMYSHSSNFPPEAAPGFFVGASGQVPGPYGPTSQYVNYGYSMASQENGRQFAGMQPSNPYSHIANAPQAGIMPVSGTGVSAMPGSRLFTGHRHVDTGVGFSSAQHLSRAKSPNLSSGRGPFIVSAVGSFGRRQLVQTANL